MVSSATNRKCSKGYITSLDWMYSSDGWTDPRMDIWIWTGWILLTHSDWMYILVIDRQLSVFAWTHPERRHSGISYSGTKCN